VRKPHSYHQALINATIALFFLGTPHRGLRTEELEAMARDLIFDSNDTVDLLQALHDNSGHLESIRGDLVDLLEKKKIVGFYESLKTPTVKKVRFYRFLYSKDELISQSLPRLASYTIGGE
jgi:hypothetical protein